MKPRYDQLANSAGFQVGDRVWLYRPTRKRGKSPKLETCWEGPYIITRINDAIYRIRRNFRAKMFVVHLDRLVAYLGLLGSSSLEEGQCSMTLLLLATCLPARFVTSCLRNDRARK